MSEYSDLLKQTIEVIEKLSKFEEEILTNNLTIKDRLTTNTDLFNYQKVQLSNLNSEITNYSNQFKNTFENIVEIFQNKLSGSLKEIVSLAVEDIKKIIQPIETELKNSNEFLKNIQDSKSILMNEYNQKEKFLRDFDLKIQREKEMLSDQSKELNSMYQKILQVTQNSIKDESDNKNILKHLQHIEMLISGSTLDTNKSK